jgi:hypothetical protein
MDSGQSNYNVWKIKVLKPIQFVKLTPPEQLKYLLHFAVMAGSTHNTQPWAFKMDPGSGKISVFLDRSRILPVSDVEGRQACLSVGWAISNLSIAASNYYTKWNWKYYQPDALDVKPTSKASRFIHMADLIISGINTLNFNLQDITSLTTRRINRAEYQKGKIVPEKVIKKLDRLSNSMAKLRIYSKSILDFAQVQAFADGYVANDTAFSRELGDWLVPPDSRAGLGMPTDTFLMTANQGRDVINQLKGNIPYRANTVLSLVRNTEKGIESASFLAYITTKQNSPRHWLEAGKLVGLAANILEANGISMAIHAGLAEVAASRMFLAQVTQVKNEYPALLIRAGFAKFSLPSHSPRLSIEEVLIP